MRVARVLSRAVLVLSAGLALLSMVSWVHSHSRRLTSPPVGRWTAVEVIDEKLRSFPTQQPPVGWSLSWEIADHRHLTIIGVTGRVAASYAVERRLADWGFNVPRRWPLGILVERRSDRMPLEEVSELTPMTPYERRRRTAEYDVFRVVVPCWLLTIALVGPLLAAMGLRVFRVVRARHGRQAGACIFCRYDLTGNVSGVCPECGTPIRAA